MSIQRQIRGEGALSEMWSDAYNPYSLDRDSQSWRIGNLWFFGVNSEYRDQYNHNNIAFGVDLSDWQPMPRFEDHESTVDYMVKFLTLKTNNRNTIRFYLNGDQWRLDVLSYDRTIKPGAREFPVVGPLNRVHWFEMYNVFTKPAYRDRAFTKLWHEGEEVLRYTKVPVVAETETGQALYWLLGPDYRDNNTPAGVLEQRCRVALRWQRTNGMFPQP